MPASIFGDDVSSVESAMMVRGDGGGDEGVESEKTAMARSWISLMREAEDEDEGRKLAVCLVPILGAE